MSSPSGYTNSHPGDLLSDEQLARQLSNEINRQSISGHALPVGAFPNQQQNATDGSVWRLGFLTIFTWKEFHYSKLRCMLFSRWFLYSVAVHFLEFRNAVACEFVFNRIS